MDMDISQPTTPSRTNDNRLFPTQQPTQPQATQTPRVQQPAEVTQRAIQLSDHVGPPNPISYLGQQPSQYSPPPPSWSGHQQTYNPVGMSPVVAPTWGPYLSLWPTQGCSRTRPTTVYTLPVRGTLHALDLGAAPESRRQGLGQLWPHVASRSLLPTKHFTGALTASILRTPPVREPSAATTIPGFRPTAFAPAPHIRRILGFSGIMTAFSQARTEFLRVRTFSKRGTPRRLCGRVWTA